MWENAKVYVDLRHVKENPPKAPIDVYVDDNLSCLHFEMRDRSDHRLPPPEIFTMSRVSPAPYTLSIPCDSTRRLRADYDLGQKSKPDGLVLVCPGLAWTIRPAETNELFLSATFSPLTNHIASNGSHGWTGTLNLKVKIPTEKIGKSSE